MPLDLFGRIVSIDIIQNTVLEQRFQEKKDEFRFGSLDEDNLLDEQFLIIEQSAHNFINVDN